MTSQALGFDGKVCVGPGLLAPPPDVVYRDLVAELTNVP